MHVPDGNGFKTSTMRLGADVIVLSRANRKGYVFFFFNYFRRFIFLLVELSIRSSMLSDVLSLNLYFSHATQSVGLLSYTYLRKTGLDDVVVPMVIFIIFLVTLPVSIYSQNSYLDCFFMQIDFDITSNWAEPIIYGSHDDWSSNLTTILEWSPFTSKEELMLQVHLIMFVQEFRIICRFLVTVSRVMFLINFCHCFVLRVTEHTKKYK